MANRSQVNLSWGTAAEIAAVTLTDRELIVDTTNRRLVLMDGVTAGGKPMASESYVNTAVASAGGGSGGGGSFTQWLSCV
jgi:hypothetical protein